MPQPPCPPWRWDLFCRVVDNFGDIGVCWRLAAELGRRGHTVRLWVDDPAALAWLAPEGAPGVRTVHWTEDASAPDPGEVVIEAFGCDPPPSFVAAMARQSPAPLWLNLEYLSAESYVERSHGLPSPQASGPGAGLTKWFFYPGFTAATGGLLRESGLADEQARFDAPRWRTTHGIDSPASERRVSVFCYPHASLAALIHQLSDVPTLLLAAPGPAADALEACKLPPSMRVHRLPWLSQPDYDRLLWACDLNCVRGEDSFVRAQWAGVPFLWHIYPQHDAAHEAKLTAFLDRHLQGAPPALATSVRGWMLAWNGLQTTGFATAPDSLDWHRHTRHWRDALRAQPDLTTQLLTFAMKKR